MARKQTGNCEICGSPTYGREGKRCRKHSSYKHGMSHDKLYKFWSTTYRTNASFERFKELYHSMDKDTECFAIDKNGNLIIANRSKVHHCKMPTRAKSGVKNIYSTKNGKYYYEMRISGQRYVGNRYTDIEDAISELEDFKESMGYNSCDTI